MVQIQVPVFTGYDHASLLKSVTCIQTNYQFLHSLLDVKIQIASLLHLLFIEAWNKTEFDGANWIEHVQKYSSSCICCQPWS